MHQISVSYDYTLEKSGRANDLRRLYKIIVESRKTPLIIDCGGNTGIATRYFCETYKEAFVICVELAEANLACAKSTNNSISTRTSFLLAGVGNSATRATIQDPGLGNWGYRVEACAEGGVEIISISSILKKYDLSKFVPSIIKIDIEGFESILFEKTLLGLIYFLCWLLNCTTGCFPDKLIPEVFYDKCRREIEISYFTVRMCLRSPIPWLK